MHMDLHTSFRVSCYAEKCVGTKLGTPMVGRSWCVRRCSSVPHRWQEEWTALHIHVFNFLVEMISRFCSVMEVPY